MKPLLTLIGVTMLVLFGGSFAEYVATHKALFVGVAIAIFSAFFILGVIKNRKVSK